MAEARTKTSALLLKKLQERLRSDSCLELSPAQFDEAYEVMEDLKDRIDQVLDNLFEVVAVHVVRLF